MARRKKTIIRRKLLSPRALLVEESRASVAFTVSWMLTVIVTCAALLVAGLVLLIPRASGMSRDLDRFLGFLPGLMMLIAAVTGILCLVLTVAVHRIRSDAPPKMITVIAVFVGVLPLATMLLVAMFR